MELRFIVAGKSLSDIKECTTKSVWYLNGALSYMYSDASDIQILPVVGQVKN